MAGNDVSGRAWVGVGVAALFGAAALSQAWVQLGARDRIMAQAKQGQRYIVTRNEPAARGSILSQDGKVLAQSNDGFELSLNYSKVPHSTSFFLALSEASGVPAIELAQPAAQGARSRTWSRIFDRARASRIRAVKSAWHADGVSLRRVPRRDYPLGDIVSVVIGRTEPGRNSTGLESSQDAILAGVDGKRQGLLDRKGAWLPMHLTAADRRSVPGADIRLTLDSTIQTASAATIRRVGALHAADQAVVVVLAPLTGDILAAAAWAPGEDDPAINGFNPIAMARFEPGSTFKVLTLAEAMDQECVGEEEAIHCVGSLAIGARARIHCATRAHGTVNPREAIGKSCNVAAAIWAQRVGRDAFIDFAGRAGLFESTQSGLAGEIAGTYNPNDGNQALQLANMSFGQAMNTTPIALASAFASLGNGGVRMSPRLIESVGGKRRPISPGVRLFRPETAASVLRMMEAGVEEEYGTARGLRIRGYRLAGKTGTAQKLGGEFTRDKRGYVSSFVGFVPAERPRALVLVMVDNPKGDQFYGSQVAGPVFREVALAIIQRYKIPPSNP